MKSDDINIRSDNIRTKHRTITNTALILAGVTIFVLCVFSVLFQARQNPLEDYAILDQVAYSERNHRTLDQVAQKSANNGGSDYSSYACDDIFTITKAEDYGERCSFANTCNDNEGIPFAPFMFCSKHISFTHYFIIFALPLLIALIVLFRMLGSTAEDYFSPSLEMFSTKLGLPPRFAGVSLLALGNGAADVSATMNAISSNQVDGFHMAMGALTGAAMFVGTVVAGVVIVIAKGVPCRGALVRDVLALVITILTVCYMLERGDVTKKNVVLFFFMYSFFVFIVLVADIYHRKVVLPRIQELLDIKERERQLEEERRAKELAGKVVHDLAVSSTENKNNDTDNEENKFAPLEMQRQPSTAATTISTTSTTNKALGAVLTALSNYEKIDEDDIMNNANTPSDALSGQGWGIAPTEGGMERMITFHGKNGIISANRHSDVITTSPGANDSEIHPHGSPETPYQVMVDMEALELGEFCAPSGTYVATSFYGAFVVNYEEFMDHWRGFFDETFDDGVHIIDKVFLAVELPFTILRKLSVPIPTDGFYCRPIVALSCILSPVWLSLYFMLQLDINLFGPKFLPFTLILFGVMFASGFLVGRHAPGGEGPMKLKYSGPIAFYGFIIAATWIDFIADKLVSMLQFFGVIFGIPSSIMGLTILAWGNSMGDLSANMTMARKGLANMAITACFAGPIFNILIGLGGGFSSVFHSTGKDEIAVESSSSVIVGFIFLIVNCVLIVVSGTCVKRGQIPKGYGYVALGLYSVYVITSIFIQFHSSDRDNK